MKVFGRVLFPTNFSAYANAVFACLPELQPAGLREVSMQALTAYGYAPIVERVQQAAGKDGDA